MLKKYIEALKDLNSILIPFDYITSEIYWSRRNINFFKMY